MQTSQQSAEHLSLLYELSQAFNASLDLSTVLNNVMDKVIDSINAERGFVVLQDGANGLDFRAARGLDKKDIQDPAAQVSVSIIEKVLAEGRPSLSLDAQHDQALQAKQSVTNLKLRAVLCAPLLAREKVLGAIYLDNRAHSGVFDKADEELLTAIAGQAAMAIENARLFREAGERVENLRLLNDISAELSSTLDINEVLISTLRRVQDALETETGSILMIEGDELVFQVAIGAKAEEVKPFRMPKTQGVAGWVVQNNEGVIVNDVSKDSRFFSGADEASGFITRQLMAAPLKVRERMLGVITVLNKPGGFLQTDLELLETIAGSAAIAIENARLYQVAVEQGRMERELQMARRVQTSLIPEETPKIKGWEFAAQWLPAREVSGDFYDFIALENGNLGLFIADVTDKGMPAALFMAFSRSIVRASLHQSKTLAEGIGLANHLICEDSSQTMPVTLFCAELNPKTGELTYVNAGHNPPLYFAKKAKGPAELTRTGLLLGLDGQAVYQQETITLESGDFVVLYTDGVTDAINSKEEEFGTERLQKVVKASRGKSTQEIVAAVETAIKKFIGEAHQYDDVTIMVVKRM